jgi:hypothetical protein
MAAIQPTDIFSGYTADGNGLTIPFSSIPGLTAAEAHAATGDAREVLRLILEKYFVAIEAMPANEKPAFMSISRGSLVGLTSSTVRRSYSISFDESVGAVATSIRPEP